MFQWLTKKKKEKVSRYLNDEARRDTPKYPSGNGGVLETIVDFFDGPSSTSSSDCGSSSDSGGGGGGDCGGGGGGD